MRIRIAVVDDNLTDAAYITQLVTDWARTAGHTAVYATFPSAEAYLFDHAPGGFDLLLLDIEMHGMNGVELAKRLRESGDPVRLVFITGYPDFIAEGYDVAALHYLMKPVDAEKLRTVLDRAFAVLPTPSVPLRTEAETRRVLLSDIAYIEAFAHTCEVSLRSGTVLTVRQPISELAALLPEDMFVRCHRSYLVSLDAVSCVTRTSVILDDGCALALSRRLYDDVNRAFIRYYTKGGGTHEPV